MCTLVVPSSAVVCVIAGEVKTALGKPEVVSFTPEVENDVDPEPAVFVATRDDVPSPVISPLRHDSFIDAVSVVLASIAPPLPVTWVQPDSVTLANDDPPAFTDLAVPSGIS
jgi:hypothetical protein